MTSDALTKLASSPVQKGSAVKTAAAKAQRYLAFMLGSEIFAIDILHIREIIEYNQPTAVPMMPPSLRGVINVRGAVVPVVDLAVRFGWTPTGVSRRTCIVIVEVEHQEAQHILGLVVDKVNMVAEIKSDEIEMPPAFGARINTDFITGMARIDGKFVTVINIARTLTMDEMAAVGQIRSAADSEISESD